jgi:hypothetical protein
VNAAALQAQRYDDLASMIDNGSSPAACGYLFLNKYDSINEVQSIRYAVSPEIELNLKEVG